MIRRMLRVAVPALARGDAERLLRFVGEAESLGGDQPFTGDLLVELGRLVEADSRLLPGARLRTAAAPRSRFNGQVTTRSCTTSRNHASSIWTLPSDSDAGEETSAPSRSRTSRPEASCTEPVSTTSCSGRTASNTSSRSTSLPRRCHWKTFFFDRAERAFSERDRLVLDLLQPHLARLWEAARTRRELAAALVGLDQAEAHESRGVILLGARGEVEYASEPARRLLREFAPDESLVEWLEWGSRQPFVHHFGDRRLIVERVGDALLLEEPPPDLGLTAREREVLTWVARGKTNIEIAQLLWLAPSTVSKHLENVYAKLGVTTRTAAVARFLGAVDGLRIVSPERYDQG